MLYEEIASELFQMGIDDDKNILTLQSPRRINVENIGNAEEISTDVVKIRSYHTGEERYITSISEFYNIF